MIKLSETLNNSYYLEPSSRPDEPWWYIIQRNSVYEYQADGFKIMTWIYMDDFLNVIFLTKSHHKISGEGKNASLYKSTFMWVFCSMIRRHIGALFHRKHNIDKVLHIMLSTTRRWIRLPPIGILWIKTVLLHSEGFPVQLKTQNESFWVIWIKFQIAQVLNFILWIL